MFVTNIGNELTVDKMKLLPEVNGAITTDLENNATYKYVIFNKIKKYDIKQSFGQRNFILRNSRHPNGRLGRANRYDQD